MLSLKMLHHKLKVKMSDFDKLFEAKYQHYKETLLSKRTKDSIAHYYGIYPPSKDKDSEKEKPICTTNEFKAVCKELGLEEN